MQNETKVKGQPEHVSQKGIPVLGKKTCSNKELKPIHEVIKNGWALEVNIPRLLENTLGVAAVFILFVLVVLTCVDVVGRYLFSAPLTGAFELTELLLAALVFLALPLTTERREHVDVDLLDIVLRGHSRRILSAFVGLFSAALLMTFAWRLFAHALKAYGDGSVTNALQIPFAPFAFLASLSCFLSAFIALWRACVPSTQFADLDCQKSDIQNRDDENQDIQEKAS